MWRSLSPCRYPSSSQRSCAQSTVCPPSGASPSPVPRSRRCACRGVQRSYLDYVAAAAKFCKSDCLHCGSLLDGQSSLVLLILDFHSSFCCWHCCFCWYCQSAYLDIDLFSVWKPAVANGTLKASLLGPVLLLVFVLVFGILMRTQASLVPSALLAVAVSMEALARIAIAQGKSG